MRATRLTLLAALAGWLLAGAIPVRAAEGGFAATLSPDQQTAAGLVELSSGERAALDQLVAADLALVRGGATAELPGTFVSRHTEAERKSAGLDRLTAAQLEKLNELTAAALAVRPKPKERPRLKESDVLSAAGERNRIHGSISVTYGWGGGRELWAQSLWLEYQDPADRFSLGLGLSNFEGDGFYGLYPDYYGGRYYQGMPVILDTSWRDGRRRDFLYGEGQSFRGRGGVFGPGHGGRRGR